MVRSCNLAVGLAALLFGIACARTVPPGSPLAAEIGFRFTVYYPSPPAIDPLRQLDDLRAHEFPGFAKGPHQAAQAAGMAVSARMTEVSAANRPAVDGELKYCCPGLSAEQAAAAGRSKSALTLDFKLAAARRWEGLRAALGLSSRLAARTGGFLWDDQTRQLFSPGEWDRRRLASWTGQVPNLIDHMVVSIYPEGEAARAVTLGMAKFGLPDLTATGFPMSSQDPMVSLINYLAQVLAEGAQVDNGGHLTLRLGALRDAEFRERQIRSLLPGAKGEALLQLRRGAREPGDPENRLIEVDPGRYPGPDRSARHEAMLLALFGGQQESIVQVRNDDRALLAASARARAKLPALRQAFNAGLAPGACIQVKALFGPGGAEEWLWVEVSSWRGNTVRGFLKNVPVVVGDLRLGQVVEVDEVRISDYIYRHPDGTEEGNESGPILLKLRRGGS